MRLRVNVNLVQLNVAVTDSKGNYITGLRPEDFVITEDKIPQKTGHVRRGQLQPASRRAQLPHPERAKLQANSRGQRTTAADHQLFGCQDFAAGGRQRLHPVRYQQLHVPRICLRAGCHLRLRALHGRRQQDRVLLLQPRSFARHAAHRRPLPRGERRAQHGGRRRRRAV